MRWRKCGLIYAPKADAWWARNYAILPTIDVINEATVRVYFASLDENNYGRIGFVDLASKNLHEVLTIADAPVLDLGELGTFDDCGVVPSCLIEIKGKKHLYYIGFQRCERVPYMLFSGMAVESNGGFVKHSQIPILDRTATEPFSRGAPFVMMDGDILKMWYWSCTHWKQNDTGVHYFNVIRYATSTDGIDWKTDDHVSIEPNSPDEYSIGRPCVIHSGGLYRMWYSVRSFSKLYSIGYAESSDGIHWTRKDSQVGIERSETGWDSEMICYPYVANIKGQLYMFYNGNRHGATGFGYAILES